MPQGIFWRGQFWRFAGADEGGEGGEGESGQAGQAPTGEGQEPSTSSTTGGGDAGGQTSGQEPPKTETFDRAYVESLRRENAAHRKRADEAERKVKEFESAQLSESERKDRELQELRAKNAELESKHREALIRSAIEREAVAAGAVDPEAVYALCDRSSIELDDAGQVKGAKAAVKALLEAKSYLKKSQSGSSGVPATGGGSNGGGKDFETRVKDTQRELQASGQYTRL